MNMTPDILLAFAATLCSGVLALAVAFRRRWTLASVSFCIGMLVLAADGTISAMSRMTFVPEESVHWQTLSLIAKSFLPGVWLTFSLTFSRGNSREFLKRWRIVLAAAFLVPIGLAIGFQSQLIVVVTNAESGLQFLESGEAARLLNGVLLIGIVLILMNLERTFRSAIGTMRWRIKFLVLGLAVIFGTRIYTRSQGLLFAGLDPAWSSIESLGLLVGSVLIAIGYWRRGFQEIEVYPSRAILQNSLTVLLVGVYLIAVGLLAEAVSAWGSTENFPVAAAIVLIAMTFLGVLLLSDRSTEGMRRFISRHFKRPQHDSRAVWTRLTHGTSSVLDCGNLCSATGRLIADTFSVLSVSVWLVDESTRHLYLGGSTARTGNATDDAKPGSAVTQSTLEALVRAEDPFDLDRCNEEWAEPLKRIAVADFREGGHRICIPLIAGERVEGVIILADRVNGIPYTVEELELLKCIGDQVAANLLNLRLAAELTEARELEAFQTMSAFFVHDLKNTASSLNLMLQNLPVHFDDPEFRKDALRGIGNSVKRINAMIGRLSALRNKLEIQPVECDLNDVVVEAIANLNGSLDVELVKQLRPLPSVMADREQIRSVVINLLHNAREATGTGGVIQVETIPSDGNAIVSVTDNGCGMSKTFMKESLFRPFRSSKRDGIGIGMFQSKAIIEAHRGHIQVESEPGKGTTFRVSLPTKRGAGDGRRETGDGRRETVSGRPRKG